MNREELLYLLPYLASLAISLGILIYTWRHRNQRAARTYSWFLAGQIVTLLAFILELTSPSLAAKVTWDKVQWLSDTFLVIFPFLLFSLQFTEHKLRYPRLTWGFLLAVACVFSLLVLSDDYHHLVYPDPYLSSDQPFPELHYDFTLPVYLFSFFIVYGANLYGIGLLLWRASRPHSAFRWQYLIIAAGFFIPVAITIFALVGIRIGPVRDSTPLALIVGNLIVAWGLFRFRLFDIVPIARERVIENMRDVVVVIDELGRVIDVNPSALTILGKTRQEVVGQNAREIFRPWPDLIERFGKVSDESGMEFITHIGEETLYFDVSISPINGERGQSLGRIFIGHNISRQKTLEIGYRQLSQELEQRVKQRTEELHRSLEHYRAVVENQTEFIVRWKADGIRTFVNEAYCRYFGITPEQALGASFLPLVAEEDRLAVEQKIQRLSTGVSRAETEVHRVINPDGSIGWQEWTDQSIFDEAGKLVEFQSVGRDITRRKHAEDELAAAYDTTLEGWAKALELRDKETEGHSRRVTELALDVARAMHVPDEELEHMRRGAILHDIGKMVIPDQILHKPGPLTEDEREIVAKHPETAYNLLKHIPYLERALEIPYCHHEKWDGSGYPRRLKQEEIPLSARIFAVVDVWDALISDRPYRAAWSKEQSRAYIAAQSGKQFDPRVVETFLDYLAHHPLGEG